MANTENIEAKLCAYVDGELDPSGRAEIEAHLASNPQHRQLMDELMKQRELLAALPRERAPEDLFEAVSNQLERAVLLDGDAAPGGAGAGGGGAATGAPHIAGQINPWPQVFAAAAVLVLAIGLAAVIYFVLPDQSQRAVYTVNTGTTSPTLRGREVAAPSVMGTDPQSQPTAMARADAVRHEGKIAMNGDDVAAAATPAPPAPPEGAMDAATSTPTAVAVAPTTPPPAPAAGAGPSRDIFSKSLANETQTGEPADQAPGDLAAADTFTNVFADTQLNVKLKAAPGVPDNSMLVVVNAGDPLAANQQLREYFANNGITWQPVTEPMPDPLDLQESQTVLRSRAVNTQMRLKGRYDETASQSAPAQDADAKEQRRQVAQAETERSPAMKDAAGQDKQFGGSFGGSGEAKAPAAPSAPGAVAPPADAVAADRRDNAPTGGVSASGGASANVGAGAAAGPPGSEPPPVAQGKSAGTAGKDATDVPPPMEERSTVDASAAQGLAKRQQEDAAVRQSQTPAPQVLQQQQQQGQQYQELQQQAGAPAQSQVFIARGLTKQQVMAMNTAIGSGNRIANYNRAGDTLTPATLPHVGEHFLQTPYASQPPAEAPVVTAKKESDSGIGYSRNLETLPTTAPSGSASGSTAGSAPATRPGEVLETIDSGLLDSTRAGAGGGAPGTATASRPSVATTMPATTQAAQQLAQPPVADDEDDRVDVVILVQPETQTPPALQQQQIEPPAPNAAAIDAPATATTTAPAATTPAATTPATP